MEEHVVPEGKADHIFVSYSRDDKARIGPLIALLESQGWSVWWDAEIPPGSNYDQVIEAAADAAHCVVVVWSSHSVESDWVFNEAGLGKEQGKLIPVAIDEVRIPLEFRRLQCAQLLGVEVDPAHPEVDKFLAAVRAAVAHTPGADKTPNTRAPAGSVLICPFSLPR